MSVFPNALARMKSEQQKARNKSEQQNPKPEKKTAKVFIDADISKLKEHFLPKVILEDSDFRALR